MNALDFLPFGLVFMNLNREIVAINQSAVGMLRKDAASVIHLRWNAVFPDVFANEIENDAQLTFRFDYGGEAYIVQKVPYPANQLPAGLVFIFYPVPMLEETSKDLDSFRNLNLDLRAIFDSTDDDLHVTDGKGITRWVSPGCEKFMGYKENELVGKSVYELEQEGVFQPSTTRLVLEKNEKVSMFQTTNAGRRLMVIATPVRDENGSIIRVVNASRDVTEESQLQIELERLKRLAEGYRQEIMNLRVRNELENKIVFRSEKMKKVIALAQKMSEVDSAVLISGDFGVGKELVASLIHSWSFRSGKPFITVNCGDVPESVLETEFFGLERNVSDEREGKFGVIEMANDGTLFLNEVEAMPLSLQTKLMQVLHEKQMSRISSSKPVLINIRIIASTQIDLLEAVQSGKFMKDLYYHLNVVSIPISSLKDRREDIIPLILHFIGRLNYKYSTDKKISPPLLKRLQQYSWPDNVRELKKVVERLFVTAEGNWIETDHMNKQFPDGISKQKLVQVSEILPLKKATELLEIELLEMTRKQYGSSTKMAEVLGVNQSTIIRKMNKNKVK